MRMSAEKGVKIFFSLYYYKEVQPVSNNLQGILIYCVNNHVHYREVCPVLLTVHQQHYLKEFWLYIYITTLVLLIESNHCSCYHLCC